VQGLARWIRRRLRYRWPKCRHQHTGGRTRVPPSPSHRPAAVPHCLSFPSGTIDGASFGCLHLRDPWAHARQAPRSTFTVGEEWARLFPTHCACLCVSGRRPDRMQPLPVHGPCRRVSAGRTTRHPAYERDVARRRMEIIHISCLFSPLCHTQPSPRNGLRNCSSTARTCAEAKVERGTKVAAAEQPIL